MIGIFGGSFDPVHFGHIKTALTLLEQFEFEHIRFIPCQLSPHKESVNADARHRWQMLNLVCDSNPKLITDDRELKRQPPSYTIDTLLELRKDYGEQQSLVLILGMDAYLSFCAWHRYEEILTIGHIILMGRPGYSMGKKSSELEKATDCEREYYDLNKVEEINELVNTPNGKIFKCNFEELDISSTMIRNKISEGHQPKFMIPGNVWNYIRRNKLYE